MQWHANAKFSIVYSFLQRNTTKAIGADRYRGVGFYWTVCVLEINEEPPVNCQPSFPAKSSSTELLPPRMIKKHYFKKKILRNAFNASKHKNFQKSQFFTHFLSLSWDIEPNKFLNLAIL